MDYRYSNAKGDTVIDRVFPLVYTDTITRIGFVADSIGQIKCFNHKGKYLFDVFKYDNGPDYPSEGLFRIVDKEGPIGFADTMGNLIIPPKYRFAYPFKSGETKVTDKGTLLVDSQDIDRHEYWQSGKYKWYFISHKKKWLTYGNIGSSVYIHDILELQKSYIDWGSSQVFHYSNVKSVYVQEIKTIWRD